ncbi:MAG TPA: imidazole glycerol phosphate synthase subunit HisH [Stellaceae bacterium]|jgi:glutamine amidotransferase|nr:imidazole glycerol phosphate synthase subunit HisH [Stellaceae bacterium]
MLTAIIDYGSGNLRSAEKAFERAAGGLSGDERVIVTNEPDTVAQADRIVLPGQGAFAECRRGLAGVPGLEDAISEAVTQRGRPFFGICVGMQLMADRGREFEVVDGLGWVGGEVVAIAPADPSYKIPHMGWNELVLQRSHPVFDAVAEGSHTYFVHSFHFAVADPADLIATADYAQPLTAAVGRDNMVGTQFHPEKSQATGLRLISNFLRWRP